MFKIQNLKIFNFYKKQSVSFKIISGVSLLILIILSVWLPFFIFSQKKILNDQLDNQAQTITDSAAIFCSHPLLIEDYIILNDFIEKIKDVDESIIMAEITRKDGKVVARYVSDDYNDSDKKSIHFYVSSIKMKQPSNEIIGQFLIGMSTQKSKKIVSKSIFELLIIIILLLTLFIILINIFLNFLISRPIRKLDIFAKKLSKGNLEAKLILKNKDEFGRLSLTLNDMRRNLKNSYEKIKNHSEELEKIVEKRTKTLTETNIELEKSYQNLLESQEKIIYLAFHDDLTGLTNRRSCRDKMENMIKEMGNTGKKMAILYIGLDDFKNINDTFGPNTGDEILKVVSVRLLKIIKTRGDVARWGSDEFVVLMPSIKRNNEGIEIAKKIIKKISETFYIEDKYINITASIGISFFPDDGSDSEVLIKKSDFALYQAKKEGKNKYHLFDKNMYRKILYNLSIAEELKNSVIDRDFELYYQPKVNLNGDIVDLEALIRWESRKYGNICPDDFIPIAENSDIIIEIGNWVLKTACIQVMDFQKKGIVPIRISINMSPRHFRYPKLIQVIKEIIKETKCDTKWIEIEITETSAMEKIEESIEIIKEINNLGIKISIDDFGKGFSSFSRLIQMKFDSIKIDKSFIDNLTRDNNSIITVNSIISLAHNLNKEVVAEGVETEEQFNILKELKCDIYQGYLFAKPMKINDIEKLLKKQNKEI